MKTNHLIAFAGSDSILSPLQAAQLRGFGFEVILCPDAESVIKAFSSLDHLPGMLITDSFLPHGSEFNPRDTLYQTQTGVALYRMLRENHPNLPIVLHTNTAGIFERLRRIGDSHLVPLLDGETDPGFLASEVKGLFAEAG